MRLPGRYIIFISSLFVIEDILLLNAAFFCLQCISSIEYSEVYHLLLININLAYLLSVALTKFETDARRLKLRNIVQNNFYRILITAVILFCSAFAAGIADMVSRMFIFNFFALLFVLLSLLHRVTRYVLTFSIVKTKSRAIILGAGLVGRKIHSELTANAYHGVEILGFFDDVKRNIEVLGTIDQVREYVKNNNVTRIYCTLPVSAHQKIIDVINFAECNVISFYIVPAVGYYYQGEHVIVDSIGDMPVFGIRRAPLSYEHNAVIKRIFDIVISSLFLMTFFLPIYLILAIIIKTSSPGPVFFVQNRTGKGGKTFKCYKFRSMRCNKDAHIRQATANDDRKTRVGNFLRKTNLDELPQFINVLKGDMSLVGPRPHMLLHTEEYSRIVDKYMVRHFIKPGITGWAQINGFRGETKELSLMEGRIKKDIWYLENWSIPLDIEIIIRTAFLTFKGDRKAY
ncbi:MAG: undecaprenyl-phosphate glucose phosphotransferase [Prevotellaceae bacterium]|jgi:putative colanic acid biosynthesis UDP-glucose lipid carrier transferase|nr:undecaprenyl-phosphate glucose phosphotransferase [Prevotellaceae bacterium]